MAPTTLDRVAPRTQARVVSVRTGGGLRARLAVLGMVPGARLRVVGVAPFGDPLDIAVGRTRLALRRAEASCILVEPEERP